MAKKKKPEVKAEKKEKPTVGRPTIYTPELAERILEKLRCGKSLQKICKMKSMPSRSCVYRWRDENKVFRDNLARARRLYSVSLVDGLAESAHQLQKKLLDTPDDKVSNDRLRALADVTKTAAHILMWIAGKYNKKFGDHQHVTQKSDIKIKTDEAPISERINRIKTLAENHIKNKPDKKDND